MRCAAGALARAVVLAGRWCLRIQVALAWMIGQPGVGAVARAATLDHVRENRGALDLRLTLEDFAELDRSFPPQIQPRPAELR
jgi:aryl-alcohol dehydrogenase-like predicted oxidoreductase